MKKLKILLLISICLVLISGCSIYENMGSSEQADMMVVSAGETMIGFSSTKLYDKTENRLNNIALAIKSVNGVELSPGEVFSFNDIVGVRTEERGYKKAIALFGKKRVKEYGGGICQLSTSLYQAAKSSGLEIVERHGHQKKIDYAKKGEDATVDYDSFDLKFKNTTDETIKINASMDGNYVHVSIDKI